MIYKLKVFDKWDKSLWCTKIYYAYGISYVLTKYYMLHQAQSTAPGLDIMLLKQRFLSLSGQVANHAGENPPVDYMFSTYTWYVLYITCISWCWWYSLYINVLTWFCLLGNYPSSSILHWRAWRQLWRCWMHYLIQTVCSLCIPSCSSTVCCVA
jgi:hypothetical protein